MAGSSNGREPASKEVSSRHQLPAMRSRVMDGMRRRPMRAAALGMGASREIPDTPEFWTVPCSSQ